MLESLKDRVVTGGRSTATAVGDLGRGLHKRTTLPLMKGAHAWLSRRLDSREVPEDNGIDREDGVPGTNEVGGVNEAGEVNKIAGGNEAGEAAQKVGGINRTGGADKIAGAGKVDGVNEVGGESDEPRPAPGPEWKEKSLADFGAWLRDLPDELPPGRESSPEACDLYTLLSEFSALRQEIRLQNREQNNAARVQKDLIGDHREIADLFKSRTRELGKLEEKIRGTSEKNTARPFLDMGDALARGLAAARETAATSTLFRKPPESISGVVEGYEMALRRFHRALSQVGIRRLETVGLPYDPSTMRAVEAREVPETEKGIVLEERLGGFVREGEVIRTAEVVVSR